MESLIVPSSIQRVRAFLVEMCGMKVKPWASAEETLTALHTMLVARQGCDIFWKSLQTLLETLARDLKVRRESEPGRLLDNELLSDERYTSLLEEIRACLAQEAQKAKESSTFRRLAQGLSAPALGLLLLLGGVATIGCGQSPLTPRASDAAAVEVRADQPDGAASAKPDSTPDQSRTIILPDAPPAKHDARPPLPDGAMVTIRDVMDSCNVNAATQDKVLSCLSSMTESWNAGFAAYLAGQNCDAVQSATFSCALSYGYCKVGSTGAFDPKQLPLCNEAVPIYLGVRFV